jgi:ATP-binding cassette subfamily B protein/ATP-binding cassette subfamily C protein
VVSHRRAALRRADQILLMDRGRLVDRGSLSELLNRSGLMRSLWAEASEAA